MPIPGFCNQTLSKKQHSEILTDVRGLNHADVVSAVTYAAYAFLRMFTNETSNVGLLGRGTATGNNG
jgi:hypothetical protein